jgi:hypothetical protein
LTAIRAATTIVAWTSSTCGTPRIDRARRICGAPSALVHAGARAHALERSSGRRARPRARARVPHDPELLRLRVRVRGFVRQAKAGSTRKAYASDWKLFAAWRAQHCEQALPLKQAHDDQVDQRRLDRVSGTVNAYDRRELTARVIGFRDDTAATKKRDQRCRWQGQAVSTATLSRRRWRRATAPPRVHAAPCLTRVRINASSGAEPSYAEVSAQRSHACSTCTGPSLY